MTEEELTALIYGELISQADYAKSDPGGTTHLEGHFNLRALVRMIVTHHDTLKEAKDWLRDRICKDGDNCPCCNQFAKIYKRKLNYAMARDLIWLVRYSRRVENGWVKVSKEAPKRVHKSRELPKLAYWQLIEPLLAESDCGAKTSGTWRPTENGILFAKGEIRVDKYVYVYNKKPIKKSSPLISEPDHSLASIQDALEDYFDFNELWNEVI